MELSPRYEPAEHEAAIYQRWLDDGCFTPPAKPRPGARTFTIMIPPPNVTGALHMGHALNGTIQDIVIRHRRMQGYDALWLPGTDHAGIATQAVVEKMLFKERGVTRQDLGREAFQAEVWKWKEVHGAKILEQFRRLGSSCDWSRTKFTMDEDLSRAVNVSFVRLFEKGLVYRGARLVNWDCVLQTAISDDEIEYEQRKGKLWHLRYPVQGEPGRFVVVATTRPETMLGDTGVAVHPDDGRYRDLVGRRLRLPFLDRELPVVADDTVDPHYGSGAVKVTPGHDPADYQRGARHGLPIVSILAPDGRLNAEAGSFAGLTREQARERVVAELDRLGLLEKVEDITHNVALSDRSKSVIEPLVSEQWFVAMRQLAEPALRAVRDGHLVFRPARWQKVYVDWLENVQDWCISRQLWWGHQIPIWYDAEGVPGGSVTPLELGAPHPVTGRPVVRRDPDVLDTWASSWLWPFATLGWPADTADLRRFYPTQFISTAREIIYLWIARMVMAGYEFVDQLPEAERCPFQTCYVHATVLDPQGRRMSKSAGNGVDPIEMIEQYGADAVRYSLMMLTREGQDVKLGPARFEEGRRFTNKIWNAARFVLGNLAGERGPGTSAAATALEDRWILSRLERTRREVGSALDEYRFNDAATALYRFVWNDFCDWYLELAKARFDAAPESARSARGTLARVLGDVLPLLHPFVPFQTEVLWGALNEVTGRGQTPLLARGPWPDGAGLAVDEQAEADFGLLAEVVRAVRSVRALSMIGERKPLAALVRAPQAAERQVLEAARDTVASLAVLGSLEIGADLVRPAGAAAAVAGSCEVFVELGAEVDTAALVETLVKRADKTRKALGGIRGKLGNAGFLQHADPQVVAEEREKLVELERELALLERNAQGLA
jgi:valyl-tRNA synthetase